MSIGRNNIMLYDYAPVEPPVAKYLARVGIAALFIMAVGIFVGYQIGRGIQIKVCVESTQSLIDDYRDIIEGYKGMLDNEYDRIESQVFPEKTIRVLKPKFVGKDPSVVSPPGFESSLTMLRDPSSIDNCVYACREPAPEGRLCTNCCYPIKE